MADKAYGFNERDVKRIGKAVRATESVGSLGGSTAGVPNRQILIIAEITEIDGTDTSKCAWRQKYRKSDSTWVDGPLIGSLTDAPAFELNGSSPTVGTMVLLERLPTFDESDGTVRLNWVFSLGGTSISPGQYQEQDFKMVAQNETGWDFDALHEAI